MRRLLVTALLCVSVAALWFIHESHVEPLPERANAPTRFLMLDGSEVSTVDYDDEVWHERLTDEEYEILREKGTEPPYTGKYVEWKEKGVFTCKACGLPLFSSEAKYESHTGWPSFWEPYAEDNISYATDRKLFVVRTEVLCSRCNSHLGHVFDDGPPPTGKRYCINSLALDFENDEG